MGVEVGGEGTGRQAGGSVVFMVRFVDFLL